MQKMSSEAAASRGRTVLHGPTMGTRWSVTLDADGAVDLAALHDDLAGAVAQVDAQMSPWKPDSDLMRLNRAPVDEWVPLADEILEVLDTALQVQRLSGGAFHPCAGDLVDAWGFGAGGVRVDAHWSTCSTVTLGSCCTRSQRAPGCLSRVIHPAACRLCTASQLPASSRAETAAWVRTATLVRSP